MKKILATISITILLNACATLETLDKPKFYSGTRTDIEALNDRSRSHGTSADLSDAFIKPLYLLDLPFSFVADTALLPIKTIQVLASGDEEDKTKRSDVPLHQ